MSKQIAESCEGETVGVIRGCIKTVIRGSSDNYTKVGNILGLRVSPTHRSAGFNNYGLNNLLFIEEKMDGYIHHGYG